MKLTIAKKSVVVALGAAVLSLGLIAGTPQVADAADSCEGRTEHFIYYATHAIPHPVWETVRRGAFGRGAAGIHQLPDTWFSGNFDPDWERGFFSIRLMRKDVGLATELGREYEVPMPLANLTEQTLVEGLTRGWGDDPTSKMRLVQEERAGVQLRADFPAGNTRLKITD